MESKNGEDFYAKLNNVINAYEILLSKLKPIFIIIFFSFLFNNISKKYIDYDQLN